MKKKKIHVEDRVRKTVIDHNCVRIVVQGKLKTSSREKGLKESLKS